MSTHLNIIGGYRNRSILEIKKNPIIGWPIKWRKYKRFFCVATQHCLKIKFHKIIKVMWIFYLFAYFPKSYKTEKFRTYVLIKENHNWKCLRRQYFNFSLYTFYCLPEFYFFRFNFDDVSFFFALCSVTYYVRLWKHIKFLSVIENLQGRMKIDKCLKKPQHNGNLWS